MVSFLTFKNKNEEINIRILKLKVESEKWIHKPIENMLLSSSLLITTEET